MKRIPIETKYVPFARSYWVVPGKFLAGYYPGDIDAYEKERKLRNLLASGIRYIINLMEATERNLHKEPFDDYHHNLIRYAQEMGIEIACVRRPIRDMHIPTRHEMKVILNEVDLAIENNKPVYVHCLGGKGRTGTVVGCYLMRHGIADKTTVIEKIKRLRRRDPEYSSPSPETKEQQHMVLNWNRGE